jgi:hypothetical protein
VESRDLGLDAIPASLTAQQHENGQADRRAMDLLLTIRSSITRRPTCRLLGSGEAGLEGSLPKRQGTFGCTVDPGSSSCNVELAVATSVRARFSGWER